MEIDVEKRVERAVAFFKEGYNCSQSVVLAYADLFGLEHNFAAVVSAAFGGGMGRLREVCGAVSGMMMIAGLKYPLCDPADRESKATLYAVEQELAGIFSEMNGSIVCRELLGLNHKKDEPVPAERNAAYYQKRPCAEYVGVAARIIGERLAAGE